MHLTQFQKTFLLVIHELPTDCVQRITLACWAGSLFALHICSVYLQMKLQWCTAVNVPNCSGTTRTGHFEDVIISLSAEVSMLIMLSVICHTVDI